MRNCHSLHGEKALCTTIIPGNYDLFVNLGAPLLAAAAFAVGCSGARGGTEQAGVVVVAFPPMDHSRGVESAYWQQVCIGMACHEVMASIVGSYLSGLKQTTNSYVQKSSEESSEISSQATQNSDTTRLFGSEFGD